MALRIEGLDEDLQPYLRTPSPFGAGTVMLHHPLLIDIGPMEQYQPDMLDMFVNARYRHQRQAVDAAFASGNWSRYVFGHERPYRLEALLRAAEAGLRDDPAAFWPLLAETWIDSENIREMRDAWLDLWGSDVPERERVMDEEERAALAALPETVEVWRGVGHEDAVHGLSWTVDRDKAAWFARRFAVDQRRTPYLAFGRVAKADVLAYFLSRAESEIVALPESVELTDVETLPRGVGVRKNS